MEVGLLKDFIKWLDDKAGGTGGVFLAHYDYGKGRCSKIFEPDVSRLIQDFIDSHRMTR